MQALFNSGRSHNEYLSREYEDLRREYEDLRREYEDLRRPFFLTSEKEWGDVWHFKPTPAKKGRHPCEKPQALLEHIIATSTRQDAKILDCFSGSGSLGEAAIKLGRTPVLIEMNQEWAEKSKERCEMALRTKGEQLPFAGS